MLRKRTLTTRHLFRCRDVYRTNSGFVFPQMKIVNEKGIKTHQIVESCGVIDGTRFKNHLELLKIDEANVFKLYCFVVELPTCTLSSQRFTSNCLPRFRSRCSHFLAFPRGNFFLNRRQLPSARLGTAT